MSHNCINKIYSENIYVKFSINQTNKVNVITITMQWNAKFRVSLMHVCGMLQYVGKGSCCISFIFLTCCRRHNTRYEEVITSVKWHIFIYVNGNVELKMKIRYKKGVRYMVTHVIELIWSFHFTSAQLHVSIHIYIQSVQL